MTDTASSNKDFMPGNSGTRNFTGVLLSGELQSVVGDIVGRDKITFGNPEFEAAMIKFIQSRHTSEKSRAALSTKIVSLCLSTLLVDQMRLLYITSGPLLKKANSNLVPHFVERAERDLKQFDVTMERYSSHLAIESLEKLDIVENCCKRNFAQFFSAHPLRRDRKTMFREMATASEIMHDILMESDARTTSSTYDVINDIGLVLKENFKNAVGFAMIDTIGMLRFAMQEQALERLQRDLPNIIYTIDDDAAGTFAPVYCVIDKWIMEHCSPWANQEYFQ